MLEGDWHARANIPPSLMGERAGGRESPVFFLEGHAFSHLANGNYKKNLLPHQG